MTRVKYKVVHTWYVPSRWHLFGFLVTLGGAWCYGGWGMTLLLPVWHRVYLDGDIIFKCTLYYAVIYIFFVCLSFFPTLRQISKKNNVLKAHQTFAFRFHVLCQFDLKLPWQQQRRLLLPLTGAWQRRPDLASEGGRCGVDSHIDSKVRGVIVWRCFLLSVVLVFRLPSDSVQAWASTLVTHKLSRKKPFSYHGGP